MTLIRIQKRLFACMNGRIYLLFFCFALFKYYLARYLINNNDPDHTIHFMTCKKNQSLKVQYLHSDCNKTETNKLLMIKRFFSFQYTRKNIALSWVIFEILCNQAGIATFFVDGSSTTIEKAKFSSLESLLLYYNK